MFKENKSIIKGYATKEDVENSADEVMRSCAVQFTAIDRSLLEINKRFDRLEGKIDSLIIFMKGHEKRLTKIEKNLQLA